MKRLLILLLTIAGMAIGLASCQKGDSSNPSIVGSWKAVSTTDPVHLPATNVTWTFGTNTVSFSLNGEYLSGSYSLDGSILTFSLGGEVILATVVKLSSKTLILSMNGETISFERI
ncbi:MAG: hypothetical protein IJV37_05890 [Bacteroidales bacterium]|nr:hypothetical protein [Bacteroidales bacterium]